MKHIALCLNEAYLPFAMVTMKSVLTHNRAADVTFHLLTDGFTPNALSMLKKAFGGGNLQVHNIKDDSALDGLNMSWSKYAWYRIFLPEVLPPDVDKVLYLDCDVCVCGSLDELFALDMEDMAIAAAIDPESYSDDVFSRLNIEQSKGYVCAGVLLMNLDYWRKHQTAKSVLRYGKENVARTHFPDQDAINVVCLNSKIILTPKYSPFLRIAQYYPMDQWREYFEHPVIIHYAGCAPWKGNPNNHPFHHIWWETFNCLPFRFWKIRWQFAKQQLKTKFKKYR